MFKICSKSQEMSGKQVRAQYMQEYKQEAVRQVKAGQSIAVTAKVLGVPKVSLGNWVRQDAKGGLQLSIANGCRDQRGIHHRARAQHQALGRQGAVDRRQYTDAQFVFFEQVAKAQDGALVGQTMNTDIQARELTEQGHVVQRLFHGQVRQVEPLLQAVDALHSLHLRTQGGHPRRPPSACAAQSTPLTRPTAPPSSFRPGTPACASSCWTARIPWCQGSSVSCRYCLTADQHRQGCADHP